MRKVYTLVVSNLLSTSVYCTVLGGNVEDVLPNPEQSLGPGVTFFTPEMIFVKSFTQAYTLTFRNLPEENA